MPLSAAQVGTMKCEALRSSILCVMRALRAFVWKPLRFTLVTLAYSTPDSVVTCIYRQRGEQVLLTRVIRMFSRVCIVA